MVAAHPAAEFVAALFRPHQNGRAYIASLLNVADADGKSDEHHLLTRSAKGIASFATRYNLPGRGCFVCVNPIKDKATRRAEKNITQIICIHADIDFSLIEVSPEEAERVVLNLPLPPSRIHHSGHGLHLYWFLKIAIAATPENIAKHKLLLKQLADILGGDLAVCEVARLMRLPGTTNSKNGEQHEVRALSVRDDLRYELAEVEQWITTIKEPLLRRKAADPKPGNGSSPDNPFLAYAAAGADADPLDVEQMLADIVYHGTGGGGNMHDTELRCSAALLNRGEERNAVVERVLAAAVSAAARAGLPFDQELERRKIEKLCDSWIEKHPEINEPPPKEKEETPPKPAPAPAPAEPAIVPVDLWDTFEPPPLPHKLLPSVIEDFAHKQGETMGADPAGLAVSALAVCSAAISGNIQLRVKRYSGWVESTHLWVALVGDSGTKKTPILRQVIRPLRSIDTALWRAYTAAKVKWDALSKEEKRETPHPLHTRIMFNDTTIEAAQEILCDSPDGMMYYRDELSGFFGSIDKYAGHRGAANDRGFWLQAYNGDSYIFDRVSRGTGLIERLLISVLGGIQPEPMRKLAADTIDDGLIQRLITIMLRPGDVDRDEELSGAVESYEVLVAQLHEMRPPTLADVVFTAAAREIRKALARQHHEEARAFDTINKRLAAHIRKYDGIFARLCLLWHCIENPQVTAAPQIDAAIARRVANFLSQFVDRHAIAFYASIYGLSDDHDRLTAVAGYILAHKVELLTNRVVQRGDNTMRRLRRWEIESICQQLEALGWVTEAPRKRVNDPPRWNVNPEVHLRFQVRAKEELERRRRGQEIINAKTRNLGDVAE